MVTDPRLPVNLDGEIVHKTPRHFCGAPDVLKVLVPLRTTITKEPVFASLELAARVGSHLLGGVANRRCLFSFSIRSRPFCHRTLSLLLCLGGTMSPVDTVQTLKGEGDPDDRRSGTSSWRGAWGFAGTRLPGHSGDSGAGERGVPAAERDDPAGGQLPGGHRGHLSLPLVIGSAAIGAIVGDSLGYLIGRRGGRRFLKRYGKYVGITPEKLVRADDYFARHGVMTVFFGRFVALLRVLRRAAGRCVEDALPPLPRGERRWLRDMGDDDGNLGVLLRQAGVGGPELGGCVGARRYRHPFTGAIRLWALATSQASAARGEQGGSVGGRDAAEVG